MRGRILRWILICLCVGETAGAQEFKLWNRNVQVHGFASQGFVYTSNNNWLTMNTTDGSGAMTDMGLNVSSQLTDRLRVGAQIYDRNLGQLGQWHPSLDWAVADYRFTNWFGIRGGKVKTTLGLYNDSQDLDFLHVFALLPQSIYPTDLRDTTIANKGGEFYGNIAMGRSFGQVSYSAFAGVHNDSIYSGCPYLATQWRVYFRDIAGPQYGADLRWETPWKGLLIGASRMNQEMTAKGAYANLMFAPQPIPYEMTTKAYWSNQNYSRIVGRRWELNGEYRRYFVLIPILPGSDTSIDARGWYLAGTYRISKHFEAGSYYSRYTVTTASGGLAEIALPTQTDTSLPQNHIYDKVVAVRWDMNRFAYLKVEGHFMDGYGIGPYPDGFYPQQNPAGFKPRTNALVVKTGFHF